MLLHAIGCIYACVWQVLNQLAVSFCPSVNFPLVEFRKHVAKVVTVMEALQKKLNVYNDLVFVASNTCRSGIYSTWFVITLKFKNSI